MQKKVRTKNAAEAIGPCQQAAVCGGMVYSLARFRLSLRPVRHSRAVSHCRQGRPRKA